MLPAARWFGCAAIGAAFAVTVSGCALSGSHSRPSSPLSTRVVESDFRIVVPKHMKAGDLVLSVLNRGPEAHELLIVRTDDPLPMREDGTTVDEDAIDPSLAGKLEPGEPGGTRELRVHLEPGHYRFICNMSGHYLGGMDTELVVE